MWYRMSPTRSPAEASDETASAGGKLLNTLDMISQGGDDLAGERGNVITCGGVVDQLRFDWEDMI